MATTVKSSKKGFTLIEMLVVIVILGILFAVINVFITKARINAHASKIIADYRDIKRAFEIWMTDTDKSLYPHERWYSTEGSLPCQDEPAISDTDLFANIQNLAGWNGPYLNKPLYSPWETEYTYDNDGDIWRGDGLATGVNLMVQWCNSQDGGMAQKVASIIDKKMDNGNGYNTGIVRWRTSLNVGGIRLLFANRGER